MINLNERFQRFVDGRDVVSSDEEKDLKLAFFVGAYEMGQYTRETSTEEEMKVLLEELVTTLEELR